MVLTRDPVPTAARLPPRSRVRRPIGVALLALGLLVPSYAVWSASTLADDLALEISVPEPYDIVKLETSILGFDSDRLAVALIQGPDQDRSALRRSFRDLGFTTYRPEPEEWIRPRDDGYDATIWRIRDVDATGVANRGAQLAIEATTLDENPRSLLPLLLIVGVLLQACGLAMFAPERSPLPKRIGRGHR